MQRLRQLKRIILSVVVIAGLVGVGLTVAPTSARAAYCEWVKQGDFWVYVCYAE
jgi:hypothetical protein